MGTIMAYFIGLVLLLVAGLFVAAGVLTLRYTIRLITGGRRTRAEVTGYDTQSGPDATMYTALLRFEAEGRVIECRGSSSSSSRPKVGRTVTVRYDPANPWEPQDHSVLWNFLFGLIAMLGGAVAMWVIVATVLF